MTINQSRFMSQTPCTKGKTMCAKTKSKDVGYKDKRTLRDLYVRQNKTQLEIAERFGVSGTTILNWLRKYDIIKPWKDESVLRELYINNGKTQSEIAEMFNCAETTISKWLSRKGIETRGHEYSLPKAIEERSVGWATFYTEKRGYEIWASSPDDREVYVHRLLAVAEYGFDALNGKQVHHKNGVPWHNTAENVDLVSNSDHQKLHGRTNLWAENKLRTGYES